MSFRARHLLGWSVGDLHLGLHLRRDEPHLRDCVQTACNLRVQSFGDLSELVQISLKFTSDTIFNPCPNPFHPPGNISTLTIANSDAQMNWEMGFNSSELLLLLFQLIQQ